MTSHFSLNIKTLSPATNAMVISLACVKFDEENIHIDEALHISLSLEEQAGRHIDTTRFHWWLKQYKEREEVKPFPDEYHDPRSALKRLNMFILDHGSIPPNPNVAVNFMWMRGVQFDWAILENLSHFSGRGLAFRHNALKCQRTFCDDHVKHAPVKHRDALKDAIYHAKQIQETLRITGEKLQ